MEAPAAGEAGAEEVFASLSDYEAELQLLEEEAAQHIEPPNQAEAIVATLKETKDLKTLVECSNGEAGRVLGLRCC